jgi:hypothetical protein
MGTPLPVDMWERIVHHLPPKGPRLVPGIIFTWLHGSKNPVEIHVSKAISQEERDIILPAMNCAHDWRDRATHWTNVCIWSTGPLSQDCITRAQFLGYTFIGERDRKLSESPEKELTGTGSFGRIIMA